MTPKKRKLVLIEWDDHASHGDDWARPKSVLNAYAQNATVGWVLGEDRKAVTLASTFADADSDGEVCVGTMTIVKRLITSRRTLANG